MSPPTILPAVRVIDLLTVGTRMGSAYVASSWGSSFGSSGNLRTIYKSQSSPISIGGGGFNWTPVALPAQVAVLPLFEVFVFGIRIGQVVFFVLAAPATATVTEDETEEESEQRTGDYGHGHRPAGVLFRRFVGRDPRSCNH